MGGIHNSRASGQALRELLPRRVGATRLMSLAIAAAGAVVVSTLTACGSAQPSGTPTGTFRIQVWGQTTTMQDILKAYKSHYPHDAPKVTPTVYSAGADDAASVNQLRLELTSGKNVPDLVILNANEIPAFAATGQLTDLQPYIKNYLPGMTGAARSVMQWNGHYVGIPYDLNEKVWFYRKDLFQQAGINVADIQTQAQFIAAGRQFHAKFPNDYIWNIASSPQQYILNELTSGNGTLFYNKATSKWVVASNPGIREAFTTLQQLRASGVINTPFDDFTPQWQAGLASGVVASVPVQNWLAEFLPTYAPKLKGDWGVTTWPSLGGDQNGAGSGEGGAVFVVPKSAPNKAAAIQYAIDMYMTERGSLITYPIGNVVPSVTAALNSPAVAQNSYFGPALINAYKAASTSFEVQNYDPAAYKENVIINNALDTFLASGSSDPNSALQTAQSEMEAQIGNPYGH